MKFSLVPLMLSLAIARPFAAILLFDNRPPTGYSNWQTVSEGGPGLSFGDLVTLGVTGMNSDGTRVATVTLFTVDMQPAAMGSDVPFSGIFIADWSLRFFQAGPGNTVGEQIGTTTTIRRGADTVTFADLNVLVPETFIYQISLENSSFQGDRLLRWGLADRPALGTSENSFQYFAANGAAFAGNSPVASSHPNNPAVEITGLPEPVSFVAVGGILFFFGLARRFASSHSDYA